MRQAGRRCDMTTYWVLFSVLPPRFVRTLSIRPNATRPRKGGCRRRNGKYAAAAVLDPVVGVVLGRAAWQRARRRGGGECRLRGGQQRSMVGLELQQIV